MNQTITNGGSVTMTVRETEASSYEPGTWLTDLEQALKYAKAENKQIFKLAYFDTCPYYQHMKNELLSNPDFMNYIKENYILLEDSDAAASPVVLIYDTDGELITSRAGYEKGGSISYWMDWVKIFPGEGTGVLIDSKGTAYDSKTSLLSGASITKDETVWVTKDGITSDLVLSSGTLEVFSGGTAIATTVRNIGEMHSISGTVKDTVLSSGGHLYVHHSGLAEDSVISAFGGLFLWNGGTADRTIIHNSGMLFIEENGIANSTFLNKFGYMYVSSGGTANHTDVNGGNLFLSQGGVIDSTVVSNGYIFASARSEANDTLLQGGWMFTNGTANNTVLDGGDAIISAGGTANDSIVQKGTLYIETGASASNTILHSGDLWLYESAVHKGSIQTLSGGIVSAFSGSVIDFTLSGRSAQDEYLINDLSCISGTPDYTVTVAGTQENGTYNLAQNAENFEGSITLKVNQQSVGTLTLDAGSLSYNNSIYELQLSSGNLTLKIQRPTVTIYSGGNALKQGVFFSGEIISSGHNMHISSGGRAENTTVENYGTVNVYHGGTISRTTLNNGKLYVSSGGKADTITVNKNGFVSIASAASAAGATVHSGGSMQIKSGGTATELLENGGNVNVQSGAKVTFASNTISGLTLASTVMTVHSNTSAVDTTIGSNANLIIYSGGSANRTNIDGGHITVSSGGNASGITLNNGSMAVSFNGNGSGITLNNGSMAVYSGGNASEITLNNGSMTVYFGGNASEIKENGGAVYVENGANVSFAANTVSGLTVTDRMTVHSNTTANGITLNGKMDVYSGGKASNTTVNSGASLSLLETGGKAVKTYVSGKLQVQGEANYTSVYSGGSVYVFSGGSMYGVNLYSSGRLVVYDGGKVDQLFYNAKGAAFISSGGTLTNTTVNSSGTLTVYAGGNVTNVELKNGGTLQYYGGTCYNVKVLYGGSVTIQSGAVLNNHIASGGNITVNKGGIASSCITKSGGVLHVRGSANDTSLMTNGSMYVYKDGIAANTVTSYGAKLLVMGEITNTNMQRGTVTSVYSGGVAAVNKVDYGSYLILASKGKASDTTVSSGGGLTVMSGAIAEDNVIYGTLNCNNGGILSGETVIHGRANLAGNAVVTNGTALTFDLSNRTASAMEESYREAMLNSYYVAREADMTISASADQENGSYILANWAGAANQRTFTLEVDGTEVGTFTVNESLTYHGKTYTLYCFDDATNSKALTLKICDAVSTDASGWNDLGTGDFNGDGMEEQLYSDGTHLFLQGGFELGTLSGTEEFAGIADYNLDGADDLLVHNTATDEMTAWLIKDRTLCGTLAIA